MSAFAKTALVSFFGLLLAVILGVQLGEGTWYLPVALTGVCLLTFVHLLFFRHLRTEALITGLLVLGYLVGNRGFAQLGFGSFLFFGEIGLAACGVILLGRFALNRKSLVPNTFLGWSIACFLVVGAVRLYLDVFLRLSGSSAILAIRDSAVVYYAAFFFFAYQAGRDPAARRFIDRCVILGLILLLPIAVIEFVAPGALLRLTFRGSPLIAQKGDLITTYLAFAAFYFFLRPARGLSRTLFIGASLAAFMAMLLLLQRSALIGFAMGAVLLVIAKQPKFLVYYGATGVVAVIFFLGLQASDLSQGSGWVSQLSDKVESIVDFSGSRTYRGEMGDVKAANNQFRLVWWKSVWDETMAKGPMFGLGFGYDLAKGFLRNYYTGMRMDFSARSPHSIWLTVLGRMGVIGLLSFSIVVFAMCRSALSAALQVARGHAPAASLAHWCAVLVLLGGASFGVVFEGPMGAIPFWTFLGLAASQVVPKTAPERRPVEVSPPQVRPQFRRDPRPQLAATRAAVRN